MKTPPSARRLAVINVVGLSRRCLGADTPFLSARAMEDGSCSIKPAFPAVTCTAQAAYLTGQLPHRHGIVGNGWFDRSLSEVHFWKQSNHLVTAPKLWEVARRDRPGFTCAKMFWWFNMYSSADYSVTPRPMYPADGRKVFDVYSHPLSMRDEIKRELGPFPFPAFWGPAAGMPATAWIADAARWVERHHHPDLNLIYLPLLDYNFQRHGPEDPRSRDDLRAMDELAASLAGDLEKEGAECVFLSEYGITPVERPVALNRIFRERGWLAIKEELGHEMLDAGASRAFAVADHQIAHIYLPDPSLKAEVADILRRTPGVGEVLRPADQRVRGLEHPRAGDLIAVAEPQSWFTYYYWLDDAKAPDFARTVDIHRKPGYDPAELFLDPKIPLAKLKVARFLLRKKLGFRALLKMIPLDPSLVKGSHGRIPEDETDWPVLIGKGIEGDKIEATGVFDYLRGRICGKKEPRPV